MRVSRKWLNLQSSAKLRWEALSGIKKNTINSPKRLKICHKFHLDRTLPPFINFLPLTPVRAYLLPGRAGNMGFREERFPKNQNRSIENVFHRQPLARGLYERNLSFIFTEIPSIRRIGYTSHSQRGPQGPLAHV